MVLEAIDIVVLPTDGVVPKLMKTFWERNIANVLALKLHNYNVKLVLNLRLKAKLKLMSNFENQAPFIHALAQDSLQCAGDFPKPQQGMCVE